MTKPHCKATTSIDQGNIANLNNPNFDIEDGFCRRLNKIRGIAELFRHVDAESRPVFSVEAYSGISNILKDTTEEIREICYKMFEWQPGAK